MKPTRARWIACLLACAIGVACSACGREDTDSKPDTEGNSAVEDSEETLSSEELAKMQKQEMTFDFELDAEDSENSGGVPVNQGVSGQNGSSNADSEEDVVYAVVTDDSGQPVKDDDGNVVTEVVSGGNSSSGGNNSSSGNDSSSGGSSTYTPDIKTFQAYWLDMSSGKNVVCNGDFLDVTFRIKEDAPDGNYALFAGSNDFANWDAQSVPVTYVEGDIAVGNAVQKDAGTPESGTFSITAGTAKGNPGDEVTVRFDMTDNPGIVALIFRFQYDSNALEIVDAVVGDDCSDYISMAVSD